MENRRILTLISIIACAAFSFLPACAAGGTGAMEQLGVNVPGPSVLKHFPLFPVPRQVSANDVAAEYYAVLKDADTAFDAAAVEKLKAARILFVPGFLSNVNERQPYFDEQLNWLKGLGVDCERLRLQSQSAVQVNAAIISGAVKSSPKPVIFIAHSKGGLDILEALISDGGLVSRVRGIIPFQSPFFGSPVAEYVAASNRLSRVAERLLRELGGDSGSMINLTTSHRVEYMARNADAIARITRSVPVISVATWMDPVKGNDTMLAPLRDIMLFQGIRNDGVVPVDNAVLPGSDYVKLSGLDHSATVRSLPNISFDRVKATKALLLMILAR